MLSIVIPTYNEESYLPNLLECLEKQTFKKFEVIVADANSADSTRAIAEKYGAKVVQGGLPAVARNIGAKVSRHNLLMFVDADITFPNDFIEKSIKEFEKTETDLGCAYYDNTQVDSKLIKLHFKLWNLGQAFWQHTPFPISSSQVMFMRQDVFEDLNGFNEKIIISEDIDIIKRTTRSDYKFKMLTTKYYPSTRRFEKHGIIRPMFSGGMGAFFVYMNIPENPILQKSLELVYGRWGNYKN